MADKQDIFTGSRVDVSFTLNTDSDTAGFYDQGYVVVPELAAFPQVAINTNMQEIEVYDQDYSARLSGDKQIQETTLVVNEIPSDPIQGTLIQAAEDKTLVRFKNFYVIDTGESSTNSEQGVYQIYDAYVSGYTRTGSNSSATQLSFTLQPTGAILAQGVAETGDVVRQGDYGVGAGVDGFPGPKDTLSLFGNSWRTALASSSDNPFGADTTIIHSQPNKNTAWQIAASTTGLPDLRIRNIQDNGSAVVKSPWIRVITDNNLPKPSDINAVAKTGDTMTGDLKIQKADAFLYLNGSTVHGNTAGSLILGAPKQPILLRPNGDASTSNQVQIGIDGTVTGQRVFLTAAQSTDVRASTRKDYVDGEILKQVSKSGDVMTGDLTVPNLKAKTTQVTGAGETAFTPTVAGGYTTYDFKGSSGTDFITHKGTGTGGFSFWNGDSAKLDKIFSITPTGTIVFNGAEVSGQIQVKVGGVRLSNNVTLDGLMTTGTAVRIAGITIDDKIGLGSAGGDTVILSKTTSNPAVRKGSTDYAIYHEGNKPTPVEIGAIALNAVVDFGTF